MEKINIKFQTNKVNPNFIVTGRKTISSCTKLVDDLGAHRRDERRSYRQKREKKEENDVEEEERKEKKNMRENEGMRGLP